ncbi:MAG TPA: hypothetical protein VK348_14145, partial [Planctomycetota bacterium]|nr:hypothetical protein [Planctomycetota bacterium]
RGVRRRLDGATAIALPAATGVQLLVQADPLGFRVAFARPVFAPASVEFRCVGLQPTFRVRLLAADDTTPLSRPIYVRIETNMSSVYRESPIGEVRCNLYEDCTILALADDEVFTTVFHAGSEGESKLDCVQGQGRKLWRVGARNGVEVQSVWWQRRGGDWQPAKLYLTSRSPCLLRNADHLDLYGFETTNARVFVISSSGRVLEAVDGGQGQWLPTRPLPAVDQDALYQRLGGARRRSWSAQLLLPGEGQETWATFREWASASGNPPPKWTPAEAPVDCAVRLVARTDEQESILPWPSR